MSAAVPITPGVVSTASRKQRDPHRRGRTPANIAAIAVAMLFLFPVYWMVATAFKPRGDILTYQPHFLPIPFSLDSFRRAFTQDHFWQNAESSIIVSLSVTLISILLAFFCATAVARFRFRGRYFLLILLIVIQMVPFEALLIPIFVQLDHLNLVYAIPGVIIAYLAPVLPFTIWTLRGFIYAVPVEIEESALVDGCSRVGAFIKVMLPLIGPGLVATSIFSFIQAWNEFLYANVLLNADNTTLPVWLASFVTAGGQVDWGGIMAGSTLFTLPVVVFFLFIQRRLTAGMTAGAVKG